MHFARIRVRSTGYDNRIRVKSPAKWGVQIAGMIFQTRSSRGISNIRISV
ncbi:MAG: DUF6783 domain-containing protein [Blautia sp.]|nr:DUF6783 domain-containing protein [Blautia sp.]